MSLTIEERLDMARLSYQEKRFTEAKVMLEGLADAHPESAETWKLLSYTLYGLHQYQAAEKSALSAIDASPSDADCHYAFGLAVAAQSRWPFDVAMECDAATGSRRPSGCGILPRLGNTPHLAARNSPHDGNAPAAGRRRYQRHYALAWP